MRTGLLRLLFIIPAELDAQEVVSRDAKQGISSLLERLGCLNGTLPVSGCDTLAMSNDTVK